MNDREQELAELRKELQERGWEFDRAYKEIAECTIEAEYKERVAKMNKALGAYDSAYNNYMRARMIWYEIRLSGAKIDIKYSGKELAGVNE